MQSNKPMETSNDQVVPAVIGLQVNDARREVTNERQKQFILQNGQFTHIFDDSINFISIIGRGGQAEIWKVKVPRLGICAHKKLMASPTGVLTDSEFNALNEFSIHMHISYHKNIVHFYGFTYLRNRGDVPTGILMEYLPSGSLSNYLRDLGNRIEEIDIIRWGLHIARALEFIHFFNIWHRDVKPGNILLADNFKTAKLADFGYSKAINRELLDQQHTHRVGTHHYMAPEMMDFSRNGKYDRKIDVYSFGITMWQMYSRRLPYANRGHNRIMDPVAFLEALQGINLSEPERPHFTDLPLHPRQEMRELIERCWQTDPENRPDMETVVAKLEALHGPEED